MFYLFDQKYGKKLYSEIFLQFKIMVIYFNIHLNMIYFCNAKLIFFVSHEPSSLIC